MIDVVVVLWIKRLVQELHFGAVISPDPVHCKFLQAQAHRDHNNQSSEQQHHTDAQAPPPPRRRSNGRRRRDHRRPKVRDLARLERAGPKPGKVALARDKHGVRGLVAAQPFAAGDVLLAVPLDRCLVETRDLPASLKNAPAALTWDIRLALQLHDAILTPDDPFWVEYGTLLPKVEEMGLPLLKRGAELDVLGPELAEPARQQQQRLRELDFPREVLPALDAPDDEWPGTLPWAWALVRSRVFGATATAVNFDDGTSGTTDRFAFVPFVDMANHHSEGSAVVDAGDFFIRLRAARDLAPGDAVTISYGDIDRRRALRALRVLEARSPLRGAHL